MRSTSLPRRDAGAMPGTDRHRTRLFDRRQPAGARQRRHNAWRRANVGDGVSSFHPAAARSAMPDRDCRERSGGRRGHERRPDGQSCPLRPLRLFPAGLPPHRTGARLRLDLAAAAPDRKGARHRIVAAGRTAAGGDGTGLVISIASSTTRRSWSKRSACPGTRERTDHSAWIHPPALLGKPGKFIRAAARSRMPHAAPGRSFRRFSRRRHGLSRKAPGQIHRQVTAKAKPHAAATALWRLPFCDDIITCG